MEWAAPDDDLRRRLQQITAPGTALLHLDYHPMNVLVQDRQLTAVLDWATPTAVIPGPIWRAPPQYSASVLSVGGCPPQSPILSAVRSSRGGGMATGRCRWPAPRDGAVYAWAGMVMINDLAPRLGRRATCRGSPRRSWSTFEHGPLTGEHGRVIG